MYRREVAGEPEWLRQIKRGRLRLPLFIKSGFIKFLILTTPQQLLHRFQ